MRNRKIISCVLILILLLQASCSSFRKFGERGSESDGPLLAERFISEVRSNNIMDRSFSISKVKIVLNDDNGTRRLHGNLKHRKDGVLLLSIRTVGGIEVARVHVDNDSIRINDKFNKIYYSGPTKKLVNRYGFEWNERSILFGDIDAIKSDKRRVNCSEGKVLVIESNDMERREYELDCNTKKLSHLLVRKRLTDEVYDVSYYGYKEVDDRTYPSSIYLSGSNELYSLKIDIDRFAFQEDLKIKFSRGRNYDSGWIR